MGEKRMITDAFTVRCSIPLKSGNRAEAVFKLGDQGQELSQNQAMEVQKALKTAAAVADIELYVSIVHTKTDDNWKVP